MMKNILKKSAGYYMVDSGLNGFHAGVTGREINTVDYHSSNNDIRMSEKRILSGITGVETGNIVMLDQVHGNMIIHVVDEPSSDLPSVGEADGLVTAIKGVVLVIRTADCVPVFLYDPENGVLAAAHSGWKGTMLNISGRCVREMVYIYGSDPGNIRTFILPSIGPESYEVNEDVSCHFPANTNSKNGKLYVDLWSEIESSLREEGVAQSNIFNSHICNRINHNDFFSHRYGDTGRNLNFAFMR